MIELDLIMAVLILITLLVAFALFVKRLAEMPEYDIIIQIKKKGGI